MMSFEKIRNKYQIPISRNGKVLVSYNGELRPARVLRAIDGAGVWDDEIVLRIDGGDASIHKVYDPGDVSILWDLKGDIET